MFFLSLQCPIWLCQIPLAIGTIVMVRLAMKMWRWAREQQIKVIPASWNGIHAHQWRLIEGLSHRVICCICHSLIVDAMLCDSCGVCLDFQCYKRATRFWNNFFILNKNPKRIITTTTTTIIGGVPGKWAPLVNCKKVSVSRIEAETMSNDDWPHHWVHGNIPVHSERICFVCGSDFYDDDDDGENNNENLTENISLINYWCCWCQRVVHENCFNQYSQESNCDFGKYRKYIIPPYCIIHKRIWSTSNRTIALEKIIDFRKQEPDWSPLFIIANNKSGNNDAGQILSKFLSILNPLQVIDLNEKNNLLKLAMEICQMLPDDVPVRILVAGGDGTVGWVLSTIRLVQKNNNHPLVSIFPLGTGNDLARVLNWNHVFNNCHLDRDTIIKHVYLAKPVNLDRWSLLVNDRRSIFFQSLRIPRSIMPISIRDIFMYNYFSVGVDALVALNFHQTRKSRCYEFLFNNTFFNRFLYFTYGTRDLWQRRCKMLQTKIILELDGKTVKLPELESIVVLNIQSWAGGVRLVQDGRFDDGKVEVLGLTSSFHIGQLMIGLGQPIFLGRANKIRLWISEPLPVQVDGEPWLQSPSQIDIQWNSHAKLLEHNNDDY